jgi:hypothetical protein
MICSSFFTIIVRQTRGRTGSTESIGQDGRLAVIAASSCDDQEAYARRSRLFGIPAVRGSAPFEYNPAMVAPAMSPLMQLVEQCRDAPLVFDDVRPDLCPALEHVILDRMHRDRGRRIGSLNVGGWKSGEDFFAWPDEAVQELRQTIVASVGAPSAPVGWAMVNRAGSHHPRHQHRIALLSGVYFVTAGSADAITPTIYECPCDSRPARGSQRYELDVEPHPGRLVVCRGETWHRVPRYEGELPRITIAFDVRR